MEYGREERQVNGQYPECSKANRRGNLEDVWVGAGGSATAGSDSTNVPSQLYHSQRMLDICQVFLLLLFVSVMQLGMVVAARNTGSTAKHVHHNVNVNFCHFLKTASVTT